MRKNDALKKIGERLIIERAKKNMTQKSLAEKSGVCICSIALIESANGSMPRMSTLVKLANALSIDENELIKFAK